MKTEAMRMLVTEGSEGSFHKKAELMHKNLLTYHGEGYYSCH